MRRVSLTLSIGLGVVLTLAAAPVPRVPPDPTKDREGNPLPKGATARLGSLILRGPGMGNLAFSPDSKELYSASAGKIHRWSAETGRQLPTKVYKVPKGDRVRVSGVVAGDRVVWFATTFGGRQAECTTIVQELSNKEISRFAIPDARPELTYSALRTGNCSITADGKNLAVITQQSKEVAVYALETGKLRFSSKVPNAYGGSVYFSPDCETLYVGDGLALRRFEVKTGKELPAVADLGGRIDLMRASPDGKRLITRGQDFAKKKNGKVIEAGNRKYLLVHDMIANKVVGRLEIGASPLDFRFAGNDAVIVLSAKYQSPRPPVSTVTRWKLDTFKREWLAPAPTLSEIYHWLAVSPDGKRFAVSDRQSFARLYDAVTGKLLIDSTGHSSAVAWIGFAADGESVITFARDGVRTWELNGERKTAASPPEITGGHLYPPLPRNHLAWMRYLEGGKKAELMTWDRKKGKIGWRMPIEEPIPERIVSHDGKRCVGVSWNNAQRLWDIVVYDGPAGKKLQAWTLNVVKNGGVYWWPPLALSPDGATLFVASNGISGLDVTNGKENVWLDAGEIEPDHSPAPFPMAVSPDGKRLALISRSSFRIFDIKTGKTIAQHPLGRVHNPSLRFAPDGKSVAVWDVWSPTVQICSAESSQVEPRKLEGGNLRATCAAFSPNGTSLVVGYQDGTALVWDLLAE